ncbi:Carboxylesterase family-domain-containing protein [Tricladium varicosporioides]|nr:Carboxylesterase family-domain-containing protein [Hymenoscyphus varicosporioides]
MHFVVSLLFYTTLVTASFSHHKIFTNHKLPQSPRSQLASVFKIFTPGKPALVSSHYGHESITTLDNSTANYIIELPYAKHIPTFIGDSLGLAIYKNIRYAQNPTGALRFSKPIAPLEVTENKPTYNGKTQGHSCYQAVPQWVIDTQKLVNPDFDWEEWLDTSTDGEDCLFLDVVKPLNVTEDEMGTLPVLVWIYGGGYAFGAKENPIYKPDGLKMRAGDNKFVWVTLNYRMGAFGFLAGPELEAQGGHTNLGLWDQRLALHWIQENIAKFGGNPEKVTLMGESAGAGSIAHQMIFTGESETPTAWFKKAILQSPAWVPNPGTDLGLTFQTINFFQFLDALEVLKLDEARELPEEEVVRANREVILGSPHGTFSFGPAVDGKTIKGEPLKLFRSGAYDTNVEILTGGVGQEGVPFVPIHIAPCREVGDLDWSEDFLKDYISNALPLIDPLTTQTILAEYPDEGRSCPNQLLPGYSQRTKRLGRIAGEALVNCNTRGISVAAGNNTYNYIWQRVHPISTIPGLLEPLAHGADIPFTFFDEADESSNPDPVKAKLAPEWQKYLMGFVLKSDPNFLSPKVNMSIYGEGGKVAELSEKGVSVVNDVYKGERCDVFWPGVWDAYGAEDGPEDEGTREELRRI